MRNLYQLYESICKVIKLDNDFAFGLRCDVINPTLDNGSRKWNHIIVNRKHQQTLDKIFQDPLLANLAWQDIEALLTALEADVTEGQGSRVRVVLNGVRAVFHRPHPQKETDKGALRSVRRFLIEAKVSIDPEGGQQ